MPDTPRKYSHIATLIFITLPLLVCAQAVDYRIEQENDLSSPAQDLPAIFTEEPDSLEKLVVQRYINIGYLDARVQVADSAGRLLVSIAPGVRYLWGELTYGSVPEFVRKELTNQDLIARGKVFTKSAIDSLFQSIIRLSEREGYPFAEVGLDHLDVNGNFISASLIYTSGEVIVYGPLKVEGQLFKPSFLQNYLMIREGLRYNQEEVQEIPQRMNAFLFSSLITSPVVEFKGSKAVVSVHPKRKASNLIDGIIGVLPNERGEGLRITGQVDLELSNLFRSAKSFELHWRSFQIKTQDLNLKYEHPALFGSALDATLQFELLKQDTTFLNRRLLAAFQTRSFKKQSVGFFLDLNGSSSIGENRSIQSFSMNYVGGRYRLSTLDRPQRPLKGIYIEGTGAIGLKAIQNSAFDSLSNSTQGRGVLNAQFYHKPSGSLQLFGRLNAGILFNDLLFINDAFRIGGLQSLRGFNENEFFATRFTTISAELRLLLASEGYLYTFFDQGFLSLEAAEQANSDTPFGFGVGALLNTGSGMLNLAFALGRSNSQPLSIDFSKIHFGYVVVF